MLYIFCFFHLWYTQHKLPRQDIGHLKNILKYKCCIDVTQTDNSVITVCPSVQTAAGPRGCVWQRGDSHTVGLTGAPGEKVTKMTKDSSVSESNCTSTRVAVPLLINTEHCPRAYAASKIKVSCVVFSQTVTQPM